jgi:hypothetical protein
LTLLELAVRWGTACTSSAPSVLRTVAYVGRGIVYELSNSRLNLNRPALGLPLDGIAGIDADV